MEWDQLLSYATAAFNWFLNEHSQESLHFLYFGHDPYLPHLAAFLQSKFRHLGLDKGMVCLKKLKQAYMLAALKTKEAHSKQNKDKYNDVPHYKIEDLVMIKTLIKIKLGCQVIPNFRIIKLTDPRQLEVSDLTDRLWEVNISDVHKILPSDFIIISNPDEQVFGRKGKYINDPHILKKVSVIDVFLQENFLNIGIRHKEITCTTPLNLCIISVYMFTTIMSHILPHMSYHKITYVICCVMASLTIIINE